MRKTWFLLLFSFLAGCDTYHTLRKWQAERNVRERVGILAHLDIGWENSTTSFLRALAYFRAEGVDKVVILGDPTKDGFPNQRTVFENAWKKAFVGTTPPERVLAPSEYKLEDITFTGEGRFPLTDLLCVHPRDGRRVNAGSMHGFDVSGVFDQQSSLTKSKISASAQGLLVLVRDEGMVIRRLDFSYVDAEEVGEPWCVDREGMISSDADSVPKFWDDTLVNVTLGYDSAGNPMYTVRWPPVLAKHTGARAFSYDVTVGNKVIRRVQSEGFYLSEEHDGGAVWCRVLVSELEGREPRFGVTPISSMGNQGPTVWSHP